MQDVMISSLKAYWERLRAGRIAPYRAEIDPREFETALENMFIIERIAPGNLRIRLAGMQVCEMMGMEVRGMQPSLLVAEADRPRFDRVLGVVMSEPAVVEIALETPGRAGIVRAAMLLMPLRSDFGEINRILGCASLEGVIAQAPVSFAVKDIAINPIHARDAGAEARRALPGFAEEQEGFAAAAEGPRLRAIEGNPEATGNKRARPKLRVIDCD
jgi:hypothetical protein